jgi:hypothetical protein
MDTEKIIELESFTMNGVTMSWSDSSGDVYVKLDEQWVYCGRTDYQPNSTKLVDRKLREMGRPSPFQSSSCVIATACLGSDSDTVAKLRKLRDDAISNDPVARDFFHVFWSQYYEWSPGVARIAAQDKAVSEHIRWSFLDPWLAWMEFTAIVGRRNVAELSNEERDVVLERLGSRLSAWLSELPKHLEQKCPADHSVVFASFERFREAALKVFENPVVRTSKRGEQ